MSYHRPDPDGCGSSGSGAAADDVPPACDLADAVLLVLVAGLNLAAAMAMAVLPALHAALPPLLPPPFSATFATVAGAVRGLPDGYQAGGGSDAGSGGAPRAVLNVPTLAFTHLLGLLLEHALLSMPWGRWLDISTFPAHVSARQPPRLGPGDAMHNGSEPGSEQGTTYPAKPPNTHLTSCTSHRQALPSLAPCVIIGVRRSQPLWLATVGLAARSSTLSEAGSTSALPLCRHRWCVCSLLSLSLYLFAFVYNFLGLGWLSCGHSSSFTSLKGCLRVCVKVPMSMFIRGHGSVLS